MQQNSDNDSQFIYSFFQVHVVDVDDNPPVFTNKIFTGGISTDVSYGSVFMQVFIKNQVLPYVYDNR